jgi:hypothetical protein
VVERARIDAVGRRGGTSVAEADGENIERDDDSDESPASLRSRVIGLAITVAVLAVLVLGYLHFSLKAVAPSRTPPDRHYPGPCWACHMVSESAEATK